MKLLISVFILSILVGCAVPQQNYHAQDIYQQKKEISTSLFTSDSSQLSNDAVKQILEGKISLPDHSRVALLKLTNTGVGVRYYGYNYWRSEDYLDLQQRYVDVLSGKLLIAKNIKNVVILPSFISGEKMSLPQMREAAVRMQAHLLVIYKIESDIFENYRLFQKNQVKAFASCEVAVLDTKTGILPYTNVITKKHIVEVISSDSNMSETRKRAEIEVSEQCLSEMGSSISAYFDEIENAL